MKVHGAGYKAQGCVYLAPWTLCRFTEISPFILNDRDQADSRGFGPQDSTA